MNFSRRELLAHLAAVPLSGLVGCGALGGYNFVGELLSPDFSTGHRLRDGWQPPPPKSAAQSHQVVIVGGGIGGLATAWQLDQNGIDDYVVLELADQPGGTATSGSRDGFHYPWGAHYVPTPMQDNESLIELFRQMGVIVGQQSDGRPIVSEQYLCREPEERVFFQGHWIEGLYPTAGASPQDLEQLQRFRELMRDWSTRRDAAGRRMFAIPMSRSSDDDLVRQLDNVSMSQWMTDQRFSSARLRWLVDYSCRDDYGLTIQQTSAWAGLFYFVSRLGGESAESQAVITWPEGNGRVVNYLAQQTADRMRCSHAVTNIQRRDGHVHVRALDKQSSTTVDFTAKHVVFAAPQFLAPHLISDWKSSGRSVANFRYGGWVVANVFLSARPQESDGAMAWDNVIYDSRSLGYVVSTHQTGLDHGATVLTWYQPLLDDDPRVSRAELMQLTWQDWVRVVVSDLRKAHPDLAPLIRRIDVMRWGHAMVQPRVGFVWSDQRRTASESLGRIHFAGTDLSGIALLEEAFDRGVQAANRCAV
ncbi:FAD-dependent oxidoreductase [Stieleria sp. TO1_6]|uniref:FAD-dependent oxidoreductase n=1 Tax=Stieleria tagensis TaxID=2956795 RepID=UPI00209AF9FC|nr:FAD-dependent oxidoreductase [Stieleria tagensis]MCO8122803.1 FAD-dependent oxidoreductase [Stieleria tagensis]